MHDFRSFVGIISREPDEFKEERIASLTSWVVAGGNSERSEGATKGGGLRFLIKAGVRGVKLGQRSVTLGIRTEERHR